MRRLPAAALGPELGASVRDAVGARERLYVHVDLDVLDPSEGRANHYAVAGGATSAVLGGLLRSLGAAPAALTLSAYDPSLDREGRVREAAFAAVEALLDPFTP